VEIARDVGAVVLVLGLLGAAVWLLRRTGAALPRAFSLQAGRKARRLEAIERVALTPQHALHLVRFGRREMIVSTHPQGCTVLAGDGQAGPGTGA